MQANAKENPDLWRALRGGGNNFGVVTRYDFRTFAQKPVWSGAVFYMANDDNFSGQVESLVKEIRKPSASEESHLFLSLAMLHSLARLLLVSTPSTTLARMLGALETAQTGLFRLI